MVKVRGGGRLHVLDCELAVRAFGQNRDHLSLGVFVTASGAHHGHASPRSVPTATHIVTFYRRFRHDRIERGTSCAHECRLQEEAPKAELHPVLLLARSLYCARAFHNAAISTSLKVVARRRICDSFSAPRSGAAWSCSTRLRVAYRGTGGRQRCACRGREAEHAPGARKAGSAARNDVALL